MSEYQEEKLNEESSIKLAAQLGTSPRKLADADIDIRLFTIIVDPEETPTSLRSRVYARTRVNVVDEGKPFWPSLVDNLDHYSVAVRGRGRLDALRGEQVSQGIPVSVESEVRNYSWIQKNLTQRKEAREHEEREKLGLL